MTPEKPIREFRRSEEALRNLSPEQYCVTQQSGTEAPGTGAYLDGDEPAKQPSNARFFMGLFAWAPGGLEEQVKAGAWSVLEPEARIVLSAQPATLWKRLNRGSELHAFLPGRDESSPRPAVDVRY